MSPAAASGRGFRFAVRAVTTVARGNNHGQLVLLPGPGEAGGLHGVNHRHRGGLAQSRKVYWGRMRFRTTIPTQRILDDASKSCEAASMDIKATLAVHGRDLRLDLFRGFANWFIFLDHIPHNVVNWVTIRNYGFSGAADLFVFVFGYAASIVYAQMMLERGFIVGATRLFKRAWQLYAAYIVLFVIYVVTITNVAAQYAVPDLIYEFNVAGLIDHPIRTLAHGLLLQSRALNLDVLQLYIILMAFFPPVLWIMLRAPDLMLAGSAALYFAARAFEWNLPSFPDGSWLFNPFCWQLLFIFGAWLALGGVEKCRPVLRLRVLRHFGIAYLVFALVMKMAGQFPEYGKILPSWLLDAFIPVDKTNLAPYRILHFVLIALLVTRFASKDWRGLKWPIFRPVIKCGEQSLAVFCVGVFLSFAGHIALITGSGSLLAQVFVSASGIAGMTLVAYYISWSKRQDQQESSPPGQPSSVGTQSRYSRLLDLRTFAGYSGKSAGG
jgi:hypothetical protein